LIPGAFDRPLTGLVNGVASRSDLFDRTLAALDAYVTFSGAVLVALIWSCWFDSKDYQRRARILVGTLASFAAGVISRFSQHALSVHPRPYYDQGLDFQVPGGGVAQYNTWSSFPSDHVAVFAGLVVVIFIARSRFAIFAIVWTALVESTRVYMGAHYPSDLIGGAALGAMVVWAAQTPRLVSFGSRIMRWEQSSPSIFYMCSFFLTYQIATLFGDLRNALGPFLHLL
jgi:undecaprenyl-diphosphatase